jgi:hypothetical protein
MQDVVLVLGYNNTRINDVKKIRQKALRYLRAQTVLCKKNPNDEDKKAADYVIDVGLEGNEQNVNLVKSTCSKALLNIVALLPFSDPGTQLGAALARDFSLPGPNVGKVCAALDKLTFRQQEQIETVVPNGYKKVSTMRVNDVEQLRNVYEDLAGRIFLKPAREGNSRGCIYITSWEQCLLAWQEVSKYLPGGVIVEELIENGFEFSWDHVAGKSWITEKQTTSGNYRAEIQQIVPAPLSKDISDLIMSAGRFMAEISGSNGGACHNEIFYLQNSNQVSAVEPNLRPAGMRIWDLAAISYAQFDPWKEWVLWAAGKSVGRSKNLRQVCYSGIRMIRAPKDGRLKDIKSKDLPIDNNAQLIELKWTKKIGDVVTAQVKDNSDFLGYIISRADSYKVLSDFLFHICSYLEERIEIE